MHGQQQKHCEQRNQAEGTIQYQRSAEQCCTSIPHSHKHVPYTSSVCSTQQGLTSCSSLGRHCNAAVLQTWLATKSSIIQFSHTPTNCLSAVKEFWLCISISCLVHLGVLVLAKEGEGTQPTSHKGGNGQLQPARSLLYQICAAAYSTM